MITKKESEAMNKRRMRKPRRSASPVILLSAAVYYIVFSTAFELGLFYPINSFSLTWSLGGFNLNSLLALSIAGLLIMISFNELSRSGARE